MFSNFFLKFISAIQIVITDFQTYEPYDSRAFFIRGYYPFKIQHFQTNSNSAISFKIEFDDIIIKLFFLI